MRAGRPPQFTVEQILAALARNDNSRVRAAEDLKINVSTIVKYLKIARKRGIEVPPPDNSPDAVALRQKVEAAHQSAPDGYIVKGVSTLHGAEGEIKQQWIKTDIDKERQIEILKNAILETFATAPRVPTVPAPKTVNDDLMTFYPIGDAHCGMHAWNEETGEDFDLKIFESDLVGAVKRLVKSAPRSKYAAVVDVGDYFHVNDKTNRTPASGHMLDTDSRYSKMVRVGVRALRTCIDLALRRHEHVRAIIRPGNHNPDAYVALQVALGMFYEDNPRVTIDQSPAPFVYHEFGKNLVGVTHGDKTKLESLGEIMAADQREAWGRTSFHYWYTGHIHQRRVVEGRDWTAEAFRTLAAKDMYATGAGYRSGRDMYAIVLHKEWGEVERHRIDISQLRTK